MPARKATFADVRSIWLLAAPLLASCAEMAEPPLEPGGSPPRGPESFAGVGSPSAGSPAAGATGNSTPGGASAQGGAGRTGNGPVGRPGGATSQGGTGTSASSGGASSPTSSGGPALGGAGGTSDAGRIGTGGGGGSTSERPPGACAGKPGAIRGASSQTLTAGGVQRTFVHYAPSTLDPDEPAPLVIVAHGWTMSGQQMFDITQYHEIADTEGFVVVYPDGEPASVGPWNVGSDVCPSSLAVLPLATGDDQAFVDAMIAFAEDDQCIDHQHVFLTGFSMGGYFANEIGCLRSDIAAIGPHSGGSHDLGACPVTRKPAIIFHGTMDGLIPTSCGTQARDRWVLRNGCGAEVDNVEVMGGHCEYSKNCPADGQVALCLFDGMDHGWAGGEGVALAFPNYESASALSWAFFKKYAW